MRKAHTLALAAWAIFLIDAAGVAWLAVGGLLADDPWGRNIALAVAMLMAGPLALLLVILGLSTWRRSPTGLWICLALGTVPIILVLINITHHSP